MLGLNECSIIFRPVCQHCGAIIESPVSIDESYEKIENCIIRDYSVNPGCCPNCGYTFTSIVGPRDIRNALYDISDLMECDASG